MGPRSNLQDLCSKGSHKQNKKANYGLGENICKPCEW